MKSYYDTSIGNLEINASEKGITSIYFVPDGITDYYRVVSDHISECKKQLKEYFAGKRKKFQLSLDPKGTPFQKKVWSKVSKIPYGKTISYFEIALNFGYSAGTRVVGKANGQNPIPIIVPCHRVINKNGQLAGYAGGLERKDWLLRHENPNYTHNSWLFSQYKDIRAQH